MIDILPLISYFVIYSFFGWILESTYKSVLQKRWVNSGFLHGPLCPIYGFGALIMYLSLMGLENNLVILFFFGIVVLSAFEYVVGWLLEVVFKTKYWDYSKKRFNIHGRVCLQNSMYWGVLGVVFMKLINPGVGRLVALVPARYMVIIVSGAMAIIVVDTVSTVIGLIKINVKLKNLEEISAAIRSKIDAINLKSAANFERIKEFKGNKNYNILNKIGEIKNNGDVLGELKRRQMHYQELLEKRIDRLRRAFPTMHSERLARFFNNDENGSKSE